MSAEHGIGQQKRHLLPEIRSPEEISLMRMLKSSLDPMGLMNPNKILALDRGVESGRIETHVDAVN
jgi:FAD/FMN-containing dehydrogenase